jgi:hypothetical protein
MPRAPVAAPPEPIMRTQSRVGEGQAEIRGFCVGFDASSEPGMPLRHGQRRP